MICRICKDKIQQSRCKIGLVLRTSPLITGNISLHRNVNRRIATSQVHMSRTVLHFPLCRFRQKFNPIGQRTSLSCIQLFQKVMVVHPSTHGFVKFCEKLEGLLIVQDDVRKLQNQIELLSCQPAAIGCVKFFESTMKLLYVPSKL